VHPAAPGSQNTHPAIAFPPYGKKWVRCNMHIQQRSSYAMGMLAVSAEEEEMRCTSPITSLAKYHNPLLGKWLNFHDTLVY
jgi:hypothetical protein